MVLDASLFSVDDYGVLHAKGPDASAKAFPRSSTARLGELLSSDSPEATGHFLASQLVHYGLPPSSVKATAKARLSKALAEGKVGVPAEVIELEARLRKAQLSQAPTPGPAPKDRRKEKRQRSAEPAESELNKKKSKAESSSQAKLRPSGTLDEQRFRMQNGVFVASADPSNPKDTHYHPRATAFAIGKALASPPSSRSDPKSKNASPEPPTHFYAAQLVHYNLPGHSGSKESIKERLATAHQEGWLAKVPKEIKTIEKALKASLMPGVEATGSAEAA